MFQFRPTMPAMSNPAITSDAITWNAPDDDHPARNASMRSYSAVAKGDLAERGALVAREIERESRHERVDDGPEMEAAEDRRRGDGERPSGLGALGWLSRRRSLWLQPSRCWYLIA